MRLASATRLLDVWQSHGQQVANSRMHRCWSNMFELRGLMSAWFATASTSKGSCLIFSLAPRWNSRRSSCAPSALCHKLVCVLRQKSAWTSAANSAQILKEIAEVLKGFPSKQGVVLLDCAPAHLPRQVMAMARKCKLQLVYIPAQTTDYLQPLDLQCFSPFKQYLKRKHQELRSYSEHGLVPPLAWLWQCMQAPHEFWAARQWQKSFDAVGCNGPGQVHKALQHLMGAGVPWPGPDRPTPSRCSAFGQRDAKWRTRIRLFFFDAAAPGGSKRFADVGGTIGQIFFFP